MSNPTSPLDLGTLPVSKLLKQYAFPAIVAMTASSLYNMVDSIFIGHGVGPLAISGLALTFPFMNLSAAFGAMVGIGASTLISVRLGQQDYKAAQDIFGNVVTLTLILGVLFSIVALVFLDPILSFFGASPATLPYAREYMEIILLGNVVTHSFFTFNAILRSTGHPQLAMNATIMAVVGNTILNPIFIYGMNMGIRGAATATILAQIVSLLWQVSVFRRPKELIQFKRGIYRLKKKIVKDTFAIGMSPFLMNSCACLVVILINRGLGQYGGDLAIGAYGIVNRVLFIFIMIVIGLNQGMQPIAGYNYGSQDYHRVLKVLRYTLLWGYVDYHDRFSHRGVASRIVRPCLYDRRRTDRHCRERNAYRSHILSFNRHANGYDQLLPEHRASEQEHFPVPDTATAVPHPPASDIASVLGCKRSMVGHAYIRCHRMYSSRNHVNYSIQKI